MKTTGGLDAKTIASLFSFPGIDPRTWVSIGLVMAAQQVDGETVNSVEFDEDLGPLVNVTLQPTNVSVRCRVASVIAGNGEGEYVPFVEGDEVLVVIPDGQTMSSPVIIGRMNNGVDKWPSESIAGQDPKKNTFAFRRVRTPFIQEYASTYMVRCAANGAFLLMSDKGSITLRDGSKGALQMGPDMFGYSEGVAGENNPSSSPAPKMLFQLDLTGRRMSLQVDDALLQMNSSQADNNAGNTILATASEFQVICGTNVASENVATWEAVLALLNAFANALNAAATGPLAYTTALTAMSLAGGFPLPPTAAGFLALAKQVAVTKAKPPVDPITGVQLEPGIGALLFKTG